MISSLTSYPGGPGLFPSIVPRCVMISVHVQRHKTAAAFQEAGLNWEGGRIINKVYCVWILPLLWPAKQQIFSKVLYYYEMCDTQLGQFVFSRLISDMKCTVMIWRSWVRTLVKSNLVFLVLLSQVVLEPKIWCFICSPRYLNLLCFGTLVNWYFI